MTYPIGNWPVCYSIPAMLSTSWDQAPANVKLFAQKLHNLQLYNLLQAARCILNGNGHELQGVCTNNEYRILKAYVYASTIKVGMTVDVTWKNEEEGGPDTTHACKVVEECSEGRTIAVECDGGIYTVCLYLDDVEASHDMLLEQFNRDFSATLVDKVYMVDVESKGFYTGFFNNVGKIHGQCLVETYSGEQFSCEYDNGNLIVK